MTDIIAQRALEALRNGVPNADAVRALGCMQPDVIDRFRQQLDALANGDKLQSPPCVPGMLINGDFGTGKSHTLSCLEQEALKRGFIVSRLVISKETPLHDPAKLFQAAVREARLPNARGSLLHELATGIDYKAESTRPFYDWATKTQPYPIVAASVLIDDRSNDAELKAQVVNWWSGEKISVAQIRTGLQAIGVKDVKVSQVKVADLTPIRFEFAARLAQARGFSGWVLLLDEVELISRFSVLQRARAYAELARWLAAVPQQSIPGITAVAAITDDYSINVLGKKNDAEIAPEKLQRKGDQAGLSLALLANKGVRLIDKESLHLHSPSDDTLAVSHAQLRQLYSQAYDFDPPDRVPEMPNGPRQAMRSHVRRWITAWDLRRLYGEGSYELIEQSLKTDYEEDPDSMIESDERREVLE